MSQRTMKPKDLISLIQQSVDEDWSLDKKKRVFADFIPTGYVIQNNLSPREIDFLWYHAVNPTVFQRMLHYIGLARARGHDKLSPWLIMNQVRWEETMSITRTTEEYMIPNHCIGYYSRMAMNEPEVPDTFFTLRSLKPGV